MKMYEIPKSWRKQAKRCERNSLHKVAFKVGTIYSKHAGKMTKFNYMYIFKNV
jgi:NAD dependent epimerase/dehydratase family enzyme